MKTRTKIAAALLAVGGCSSADSKDLATNEIEADFVVQVNDKAHLTTFNASFGRTSTDIVTLTDGDEVHVVTDKDANVALPKIFTGSYSANVDGIDRTTATWVLNRPHATSAPGSTIAILPPATLTTAPAAGSEISYAGGQGKVPFAWSNVIADATVKIGTYPCTGTSDTGGREVADTGSYELSTSDMFPSAPTAPECIRLSLTREVKNGKLDPAFKSGQVRAIYYQIIDINLVP